MQSLYLKHYDAFVRWHEVGQGGQTVICLAGLGLSTVPCFLPIVTQPNLTGYRFVMMDFLGAGDSDAATGLDYSLANHAATVAAVIEHLGCGHCPVLGYSMGGSIAIELTHQRPDLVERLIIAEGNLFPGGGTASRYIGKFSRSDFETMILPDILANNRQEAIGGSVMAQAVATGWARADPRAIYENARMLVTLPADFAERFFALTLPRRYLLGELSLGLDGRADCPAPALLAQHGVAADIIAGVGHELPYANPHGFAKAVAKGLIDA
jgi:pimeloyl-ACP methyl ester carboxylesterase